MRGPELWQFPENSVTPPAHWAGLTYLRRLDHNLKGGAISKTSGMEFDKCQLVPTVAGTLVIARTSRHSAGAKSMSARTRKNVRAHELPATRERIDPLEPILSSPRRWTADTII
jgi:hypothetical protein